MEVIKLGKKGQVSIPKSILSQLGLSSETLLLVETTQEGGILLQPAGVYPIEVYSQERLDTFAEADQLRSYTKYKTYLEMNFEANRIRSIN